METKKKQSRNGRKRATNVVPISTISRIVDRQMIRKKQTKFVCYTFPNTAASTTMSFWDVTVPSVGTSLSQRIGSSIRLKAMRVRGQIILGDTTNLVRVVWFRWLMDSSSDTPSNTELCQITGDPLAEVQLFKPRRFSIVKDDLYTLDAYHPTVLLDYSLNVRDNIVQFSSGNYGQDHIWCAVISDSSGVPHPSVNFDVGLSWTDTE